MNHNDNGIRIMGKNADGQEKLAFCVKQDGNGVPIIENRGVRNGPVTLTLESLRAQLEAHHITS